MSERSYQKHMNGSLQTDITEILCQCTCPACGYHVAVPFYDGGNQPLATVAWPNSASRAHSMKRLPLAFKRCVDCGHVYNSEFIYANVPYSEKPNLMFNKGEIWSDHLSLVRDRILERLPTSPTVIEIGCGDGHFLLSLAEARPSGRYIGFDPNASVSIGHDQIETYDVLFKPLSHLPEYRPDMIISRHVLEHLMNPLGFIQALAFAADWNGIETSLFIEVPCIDRVFFTGRTNDFFYEHNSNFTTTSFEHMLMRCTDDIELVECGYNDEVVYGFAHIIGKPERARFAREAIAFRDQAINAQAAIKNLLKKLSSSGKKVAVWGGTGKGAAFINYLDMKAERFPLVVDSDPDKAGTFVPGTGQEIRFRDYLLENPVEVILITTQWRARDIVAEITQCGISYEKILVEHQGRLIEYFGDSHPYRED